MVETIAQEVDPQQRKKLVYVADSKFFSKDNVLKATERDLKFISLVSAQHKLRELAIDHVLEQPEMTNMGKISPNKNASSYAIQEWDTSFHDQDLRVVTVYSSSLFAQKQTTFHQELDKEKASLEAAIEKLSKQEFSCEKESLGTWQE